MQFLKVNLPPMEGVGTGVMYLVVEGSAPYRAVHCYTPAEGNTQDQPTAYFDYTVGKTVTRKVSTPKGRTLVYKDVQSLEYNSVPITNPDELTSLITWLDSNTINTINTAA